MASDNIGPLVYSLYDALMLLAPAGWVRVDLSFMRHEGALRLSELATRGEGTKDPRPKPELKLDTQAEAERLAEGFAELGDAVQAAGKTWSSLKAQVERSNEASDLRLLRDDGQVLWFTRLTRKELDTLLMTDALFDALLGTQRAFADLQARFEARAGTSGDIEFDGARGVIRLAGVELPVQCIGHYLPEAFAWLWSWADDQVPAHQSEAARKVCQPELQGPGLSAMWRPMLHCDDGLIWSLASHVVVGCGARGLVQLKLSDGATVFLAVMKEP